MSDIKIIGAGITGPMAALTAARAGHDVTVYEQRPADALHSIGILGITPGNWAMLQGYGVDLSHEITSTNNLYRDVVLMLANRSPFHWIVWSDLHNAVTDAAYAAGARFSFQTRASVEHTQGDYVFDAGGVVSAAHRGLPSRFIHQVIYRGISPVDTTEGFTTYKLPDRYGFLDFGHTRFGAAWAFGVHRESWPVRHTTFTDTPPLETNRLPAEYRKIITTTKQIMVLPQAAWSPPQSIVVSADWRRFSIGDANGAVRPLTTSGANLGLQAGNRVLDLMDGNREVALSLLKRRAYALDLGLQLTGPEIGGDLEDPDFASNQRILYGW